ncbi:hypothetical protein DEU56DRAFT_370959 [Suillus clintonianus]|uniref:uncharacterized protein n=1 Tax=Suillus clintonianus TaxID=1904413 RepID=UPI001B85FBF9|nr:uncharacterized protein DEU56DRAFT_370959 [Suillus clintonianus]KAG2154611.1 hypothetical protein DEU56DRAFT_370959 [Suillus clintonianus]
MQLDELPAELYAAIISHLPADSLQQDVLALTRVCPRSPVPTHSLFEHIRLKHAQQIVQLYRRLHNATDERKWVKDFGIVTWTVDADVLVNLLEILPSISSLLLFVGPSFAPEHLEEIFHKPREDLRFLSLRFRPYVNRATYYQFLKGAYFDTTLTALSRWPPCELSTLSIVQDPLDPEISSAQHFAQPLVFFRLDPISVLLCSAYISSLTRLRLRIPSRQVSRFISSIPSSVPALRLLDLSTCNVLVSDMEGILIRFHDLQHLILDGCGVARDQSQASEWNNIGKICATATVRRAKAREKVLKTWLERNAATTSTPAGMPQPAARRIRPGRRGLATATISFREEPTASEPDIIHVPAGIVIPKVRVVPSPPTLLSLSTSSAFIPDVQYEAIREDFERGWNEGLAQLAAVKSRLYQSWKNGVQMMRITADASGDGYNGLEAIEVEDAFHSGLDDNASLAPPILCLAGSGTSGKHIEGCGHNIARDVWNDMI